MSYADREIQGRFRKADFRFTIWEFNDHRLPITAMAEADAICDGEEVYIIGIMEHIEPAGIHSGGVGRPFVRASRAEGVPAAQKRRPGSRTPSGCTAK